MTISIKINPQTNDTKIYPQTKIYPNEMLHQPSGIVELYDKFCKFYLCCYPLYILLIIILLLVYIVYSACTKT